MANTSKNSLGYRINYREGTISVSERLIKEANREGIAPDAFSSLTCLLISCLSSLVEQRA